MSQVRQCACGSWLDSTYKVCNSCYRKAWYRRTHKLVSPEQIVANLSRGRKLGAKARRGQPCTWNQYQRKAA